MPGHTYTGLKRYADAAYQQEGSARVNHAYMFRDRVMPFEIHNYAHNNQWLCTSYSHIGRVRDAIARGAEPGRAAARPQKNGPNDGGSPQRYGRLRWSELLVRYELWDDLIEATTVRAIDWTNIPQEQVQRAHTLGLAYAAKGDAKQLAEQVEVLEEAEGVVGEERAGGARRPPAPGQGRGRAGVRPVRQGDHDAGRGARGAHLAARNYGFAESVARRPWTRTPSRSRRWRPTSRSSRPSARRRRRARPTRR